jgi:hypothetical protein
MATVTLDTTWQRPAMVIFTETQPSASVASAGIWNLGASGTYLYLTDDNRSDLQVSLERIEYKKRMINGRMRSYHVADKKSFSFSWTDIPSRSSGISEVSVGNGSASVWAGGREMVDWHNDHAGSFYIVLVYDTTDIYTNSVLKFKAESYNVFFDSISYNVKKRGTIYDLWDVSMSLVEV